MIFWAQHVFYKPLIELNKEIKHANEKKVLFSNEEALGTLLSCCLKIIISSKVSLIHKALWSILIHLKAYLINTRNSTYVYT